MNKEIHFFDLDGTLWDITGKIWIISKDAPNVPIVKIDREEFALIKAGIYKDDNIEVEYNGDKIWLSQNIMSKVLKKRKLEPDMLGFSFRELFDTNYIDKITIIVRNIIDLNNKKIDIGILSGRHNQEGEAEYINLLRVRLNELNLDINKIYYLGNRYNYGVTDTLSFTKTRILLEHLVGIKIEKDRFNPLKQDWYKRVYFYDDEIQNIFAANRIQFMFDELIRNTEDEVFNMIMERINDETPLVLVTNLITNNVINKFKSTEIILRESTKFPIQLESNNIKKFSEL